MPRAKERHPKNEFQKILLELEQRAGLNPAAVAKKAGVSLVYYMEIWSKDRIPKDGIIIKLAHALNCPLKDLLLVAYKEKTTQEAKSIFEPAAPKYPLLRKLALDRCKNKEVVSRSFSSQPYTHFERIVYLQIARCAATGDKMAKLQEIAPSLLIESLSLSDEEQALLKDLIECVESWRYNADDESISVKVINDGRPITQPLFNEAAAAAGLSFFGNFQDKPATVFLDPDIYEKNPGLQAFLDDLELSAGLLEHEFQYLKSVPPGRGGPPTKEGIKELLSEYREVMKKQREVIAKISDLSATEINSIIDFIEFMKSRREKGHG